MSPRGERWFDQEAGPVVRLYALTKGRARPAGPVLDVVDVVVSESPRDPHRQWLPPEHRQLLDLCGTPIAVADLASETGLPLGVVQVLLSDLNRQGLVAVVKPTKGSAVDENVLKSVLEGLRAL
jgi:predicted Rossmann fold nucleotide-binding protein DprA/Smf involved in DNA uptake